MNHIKKFEELNYVDTFEGDFLTFKKEYTKYKNDGDYYVQFTDYKNDILDRTIHDNPDHVDPSGNYGYPLKYIIEYPADVWYGHNSKYLRVLKANPSNNTLYFNEIKNEDQCMDMLRILLGYTIRESREAISLTKKYFKQRLKLKNSGYWGRMTLQILQVDPFSSDFDDYTVRTGVEQSEILLKAGFDAFEDTSKKDTTAVINDREPEQICFLNRKAFTVDKIYTLMHRKNNGPNTTLMPEYTKIGQRVAVDLFSYMDDRISGKNSKAGQTSIFYSKKGRSIKISYTKNDSYYKDKNMGQKFHKVDKYSDDNKLHVTVNTEKGEFDYSSTSDQTVEEVLKQLKKNWDAIKDNDTIDNWIPRSDKQALLEEEEAKKKYFQEQNRLREEKNREEFKKWMAKYMAWCKHLNIDFKFGTYENGFILYDECFLNCIGVIRNNPDKAVDFLKTRAANMVLTFNPNFDKKLLNDFIDSLVIITEKLISIDKIFIEYNFNNYLEKNK